MVGCSAVAFAGTSELINDRMASRCETGLDYFGARYFSGAQGRFTSPDAPFADQYPEDPQPWNMYGYVRNNPLKNVDPNGRGACGVGMSSCLEYIAGGVGTVGNAFTSGLLNAPNRLINMAISPFTNYQLPDAVPDAYTPRSDDEKERSGSCQRSDDRRCCR
jgi:RHS repeat-associated protein